MFLLPTYPKETIDEAECIPLTARDKPILANLGVGSFNIFCIWK